MGSMDTVEHNIIGVGGLLLIAHGGRDVAGAGVDLVVEQQDMAQDEEQDRV